MADNEDLRALHSGDLDLVRRDFRDANLSGLDLSERDFTGSHLERANLTGANLRNARLDKCHFMNATFSKASLVGVELTSTALTFVDLSGADLRNSNFSRCHFQQVNFDGADLRGANFSDCRVNDKVTFEGSLSDENTQFDRTYILRAAARSDTFRYYRVDRGQLFRVSQSEPIAKSDNEAAERRDLAIAAERAAEALKEAVKSEAPNLQAAGIGHNQPPPDEALSHEEFQEVQTALAAVAEDARSGTLNDAVLTKQNDIILKSANRIGAWIADKTALFTDEYIKTLGQESAKATKWIGLYLLASGYMHQLVALIIQLLGV